MIPSLLIVTGIGLIGYKLLGLGEPSASTPVTPPTPAPVTGPTPAPDYLPSKFKVGDYVLSVRGSPPTQNNVAPMKIIRREPAGWIGESLETPGRFQTLAEPLLLGPVANEMELMALYAKTLGLPVNFGFNTGL